MRRAAVLAVVGAALALRGPGHASDEVNVQVAVDQARPAADELVRLTYTFTGPGLSGSCRPAPIPLKNLSFVSEPSRSEQISFINGVVSRSLALTYFLRPHGPGPAEIGEATFAFGDRVVKAPSYLLEVGPPRPAGAAARPREPASEEEDPIAQFFRRRDAALRPRAERGARPFVEYRVTPDKTTAYVGEEIVLTFELLTQADVQGLEYLEPPKFPGLWAEDLEKPERPEGRRDVVDGRTVMRFTLLKKAVSGLSPGVVTLPESKIRTSVRIAPDNFGDPFGFFPRPEVLDLVARPVTLKVLAIPGRPDFKGPVGRFDLTARTDRDRTEVGGAVTLRVRLAGAGNVRTASEPPALEVPGARIYPPTTKSDPSHLGKTQSSTEWTWVLVPTAPGTLTIPPISVEVFDPVARQVVTKSTTPIRLVAEGGPGTAASAAGTGAAETVLPPSPAPAAAAAAPTSAALPSVDLAHGTVAVPLWALAAIPVAGLVAVGGTVLVRRRRNRAALALALDPEPGETKERAAARIDRALRAALARRHDLDEALPASEILAVLREKGLPASRLQDVKDLFEDTEFLRQAPQLGEYDARIREVRARAGRILPRLG